VLIVPLFVAGIGSARAQFVSGVNLVEVYATVTDRQGQPVEGLESGDFQVAEDGVPQTISAFGVGDVPLAVAIALDRSFSMRGERLGLAKRAADAFIRSLRPADEVMVLGIGSEVETISPPIPARDATAIRWETIDAWGTTPLYDAALTALAATQDRKGRRALLIVSDGVDRGSETTATALIERARRMDVLVYPVTIAAAQPPVLAELAAVTGGRSVSVREPRRLDATLASIARELRSQYLLGYVPSRPQAAAAWHAIDVRVNRRDVRVRARDGYYAR